MASMMCAIDRHDSTDVTARSRHKEAFSSTVSQFMPRNLEMPGGPQRYRSPMAATDAIIRSCLTAKKDWAAWGMCGVCSCRTSPL
jgi:hypothetical protein